MWESLILEKVSDFPFIAYALLFIGMIIEGEGFLIAGIFLAYTGYIEIPWVFAVAFAGMLFGDIVWYWGGPHLEKFLPKKVRPFFEIVDTQMKKRPFTMIFLAKFIYYLHRIVLARVRTAGITFKQFIKPDLLAVTVWLLINFILAEVLAVSFNLIKDYIKYAEIGLLVVIVVLITAEHYIGKYFKTKFRPLQDKQLEK